MSRSRKKYAVFGYTGDSEKQDKVIMHKRMRRKTHQLLKGGDVEDVVFPIDNEVMNPYNMAKDGKGGHWPKPQKPICPICKNKLKCWILDRSCDMKDDYDFYQKIIRK